MFILVKHQFSLEEMANSHLLLKLNDDVHGLPNVFISPHKYVVINVELND